MIKNKDQRKSKTGLFILIIPTVLGAIWGIVSMKIALVIIFAYDFEMAETSLFVDTPLGMLLLFPAVVARDLAMSVPLWRFLLPDIALYLFSTLAGAMIGLLIGVTKWGVIRIFIKYTKIE